MDVHSLEGALEVQTRYNGVSHAGLGGAGDNLALQDAKVKIVGDGRGDFWGCVSKEAALGAMVTTIGEHPKYDQISSDTLKDVVIASAVFIAATECPSSDSFTIRTDAATVVPLPLVQRAMKNASAKKWAGTLVLHTKANFLAQNHHVGQGGPTGAFKKATRVMFDELVGANSVIDEAFTSLMWMVVHWLDTASVWKAAGVTGSYTAKDLKGGVAINQQLKDRFHTVPAGHGKWGIAYVALGMAYRAGYLPFVEPHPVFPSVPMMHNVIMSNQVNFHEGARHFVGANQVLREQFPDEAWSIICALIRAAFNSTTIGKSPAIPPSDAFTSSKTYTQVAAGAAKAVSALVTSMDIKPAAFVSNEQLANAFNDASFYSGTSATTTTTSEESADKYSWMANSEEYKKFRGIGAQVTSVGLDSKGTPRDPDASESD